MHTLLLTLLACDEPPESAPPPQASDCVDLSGDWTVTETIDRSGCDASSQTVTVSINWKQTGCSGALSDQGAAITLPGRVEGQRIIAGGTYRDLGKIRKDLDLKVDGDIISGTATWTWRPGKALSCSGTSTVAGKRKL
ncbi:MAG: hypothetical protein AAFV53_13585 [Myxococcota bacterium]